MRTLSDNLSDIQANIYRRYGFKVYVYDIVSTRSNTVPDTISRLVQGATLDAIAGPLDITDFVADITFTERSSYVAGGSLQGNSVALTVIDKGLTYDPVGGSESRWLRQGNLIRIYEGDLSLDEADWANTFTGTLVGRAGASARDRNNNATLQLAAEDRMASLLKIKTTSQAFEQGTDYAFCIRSILETELGWGSAEFDLGASLGSQITTQAVTQFVDESPMLSIAKILFLDGFVPKFRGDGVLEFTESFSSQSSDVIYENEDFFESFTRPFSPLEDINEVEVIGLEADMSKIVQPTTVLATAGITLGFFGGDARIRVSWSDDNTQQADNVRLNALSSVTGALVAFGSPESLDLITDNDGGTRGGHIEIEGAFYAPLTIVLYAARIAASFIPDTFAGFGGGSTIPVGRIIEGVASIAIGFILATIGRGDYEILGEPYEYVFQEIRGVARVGEIPFLDIRPLSIENHLIDSQSEADAIALRELITVRKRGNAWGVNMRHDLRLEPNDKFTLPDNREFVINEITRRINRDENKVASLSVYETTTGVNP